MISVLYKLNNSLNSRFHMGNFGYIVSNKLRTAALKRTGRLKMNPAGRYGINKRAAVFHKQHGRSEFQHELLDLHTGENVNEIERFIPDIQIRLLAQTDFALHGILLSLSVYI